MSADIAVIGAGSWGTALANAAARAGRRTLLYARNPDVVTEINNHRTNETRLPGCTIHAGVTATTDLAAACAPKTILLVVPAQGIREMARQMASHIGEGSALVICAKGIERDTGRFLSDIIAEEIPRGVPTVLSGPGFAGDVVHGLPTAVTLAARDEALAEHIAQQLASPSFRLYHSTDLIGVEIGGAAKNVLAIAAGLVAGRKLGASASAALVTRGFAELSRFARAFGARPETLMGLSGLGDLILSSTTPQSRNFALGFAIGSGGSSSGKLAEGAYTAKALVRLADQHQIDMPIARAVDAVLDGTIGIDEAVRTLMSRPQRREEEQ